MYFLFVSGYSYIQIPQVTFDLTSSDLRSKQDLLCPKILYQTPRLGPLWTEPSLVLVSSLFNSDLFDWLVVG